MGIKQSSLDEYGRCILEDLEWTSVQIISLVLGLICRVEGRLSTLFEEVPQPTEDPKRLSPDNGRGREAAHEGRGFPTQSSPLSSSQLSVPFPTINDVSKTTLLFINTLLITFTQAFRKISCPQVSHSFLPTRSSSRCLPPPTLIDIISLCSFLTS